MTTNWKDLARATLEGIRIGSDDLPPEPATPDGSWL